MALLRIDLDVWVYRTFNIALHIYSLSNSRHLLQLDTSAMSSSLVSR